MPQRGCSNVLCYLKHACNAASIFEVVKETLRHHPIVTDIMPKVVGPKGDTHNGLYLPPGTEIGVCMWELIRNNTAVYGEDAKVFRPERWLEASPEKLARMERTVELNFGHGRFPMLGRVYCQDGDAQSFL